MNKDSVLIVDDNQLTRETLKTLVENSGLTVDTCEDGKSAIGMARECRHSVFLVDYRMPKMTGDLVTAQLRALWPDVFIIGFSLEDKERVFLEAGANVFVNKANLHNDLIRVIQNRRISLVKKYFQNLTS